MRTPMRRMRPDCCARAESGHPAAELAIALMKSRRRIAFLEAWDHAGCVITAGIYDRRNGFRPSFCTAIIPGIECPLWVKSRHARVFREIVRCGMSVQLDVD